jgi:hypothetical protein
MFDITVCLLALNAIWDAISVGMMLAGFDEVHWMLWADSEDRDNQAARVLFLFMELYWGLTRGLAAIFILSSPWLAYPAMGTYAIEGLFLVLCGCAGIMRRWRAITAGVLSWACLGVIFQVIL